MLELEPFQPDDPAGHDTLIALWNGACGPALSVTRRLFDFNTRPTPAMRQTGCMALRDGAPVGFVLASAESRPAALGWVDALAVAPESRRIGAGSSLLAWAESWLVGQGCGRARLGGSLLPFVPGVPADLAGAEFFQRRGYDLDNDVWDVARDLRGYTTPGSLRAEGCRVAPTQPDEADALLEFMGRAFPGRWEWECREHLRAGGRSADFIALWADGRVEGFCQITLADSLRPLDRFFMRGLPEPWGQAGPLGVSREARGRGYGAAVIDGALRHLSDRGIAGCVIDWTNLLDLYGKFGFQPYRRYVVLLKALA